MKTPTTPSFKLVAPSYFSVLNAEKENQALGHENKGFLSFERGFMPNTPLQSMPAEFAAWDELAASLPVHYKNQTLRKAFHEMPVLVPSEENLDAKYLCRASLLMSMFAHAYVRCERHEDLNIPASIQTPWEIVTARLGRPAPFLSYIDLIIYNWKMRDAQGAFEVENLDLLVATVNNNEERVFYTTQMEIIQKAAPVVKEVVDIQTAILNNDVQAVINGLHSIRRIMQFVTEHSFQKISLNPRSSTYVDPVIWAKTVAPFAVPLKEGVQGPSGLSAPVFHLMDTFIERTKYDTILGKEALFMREWFPMHWRNLFEAVEEVSLSEFIEKTNSEELNGAYYSMMESYSGKQGFLGAHKRKVYGYLQTAFKIGRSATIAGFNGLFKERTWEQVDNELEKTRMERYDSQELRCPYATIHSRKAVSEAVVEPVVVRPMVVDSKVLIDSILKSMNLSGKTQVKVNAEWQKQLGLATEFLPLEVVLQAARLDKVNLAGLNDCAVTDTDCFRGIQKSRADISLMDFVSIVFAHGISTQLFKDDYFISNVLFVDSEKVQTLALVLAEV